FATLLKNTLYEKRWVIERVSFKGFSVFWRAKGGEELCYSVVVRLVGLSAFISALRSGVSYRSFVCAFCSSFFPHWLVFHRSTRRRNVMYLSGASSAPLRASCQFTPGENSSFMSVLCRLSTWGAVFPVFLPFSFSPFLKFPFPCMQIR
ncbi:unnamed protein product, partial [Phaeothamnion confervicola]